MPRRYERLKADLYTLTVRTRTADMDAAADAAEQLVGGMLDQLQKDLGDDIHRTISGAVTPPGFQLDAGVKAQGISASISEAGWPAAMASSVAFR